MGKKEVRKKSGHGCSVDACGLMKGWENTLAEDKWKKPSKKRSPLTTGKKDSRAESSIVEVRTRRWWKGVLSRKIGKIFL